MAANSLNSFSPRIKSSSYNIEGVVIKRSNFGEADKLVTLFTRLHGKLTLKAKGLRKLSSKRAGTLELFNHVKANAIRGRGELDTLAEVELINSYSAWRKHLGRVTVAYQICEVVDKLTPDAQPHPEIFDLLTNFLSQITQLNANWQTETENWLLGILVELGYWPKGQKLVGSIDDLLESTAARPLHSKKLLIKLKTSYNT